MTTGNCIPFSTLLTLVWQVEYQVWSVCPIDPSKQVTKGRHRRPSESKLTSPKKGVSTPREVLDVRGRSDFSNLTLARRGPTLATLVRPRSEDLGGGGGGGLRLVFVAQNQRTLAELPHQVADSSSGLELWCPSAPVARYCSRFFI
jgi:hypothetical protein